MTPRRRRALASALGALVVAVLCAVLSSNVHGGQRTVLLLLTVAWLVIAGTCVANALRSASVAEVTAPAADAVAPDAPVGPVALAAPEAPTAPAGPVAPAAALRTTEATDDPA